MVAQDVEKTREEKEEILHVVNILEGKFELLCKSQYGIKFSVTLEGQNQD
jgi:hypothetical protein